MVYASSTTYLQDEYRRHSETVSQMRNDYMQVYRPVKFGKLIRVRLMIVECLNLLADIVGRGRKLLKSRCSKTASE